MTQLSEWFDSMISIVKPIKISRRMFIIAFIPIALTAGVSGDSNFTTYLQRVESLRDRAMTYAYYLRASYLKNRVIYSINTGRKVPGARNDIADSAYLLEKALDYSPDSITLLHEYGTLNEWLGRIDKVISSYEHIAQLDPNREVYVKLGVLYELGGKPDVAVKQYQQALSYDNESTDLQEHIVDIYIDEGFKAEKRGDNELAKVQFSRALDKLKLLIQQKSKYRFWLKAGLLYEISGEINHALNAYKTSIELEQENAEPYIRLSRIYCAMGEAESRVGNSALAVSNYTISADMMLKVVPAKNSKPDVMNFTAYVLALSGKKLDFAEKLAKEAVKNDERNGAFIDTLGWVYFKQGDAETALKKILLASEIEGDDPVISDHLGDIYLSLGQSDKAKEMWEKSLLLDAKNLSVKYKLNNLR